MVTVFLVVFVFFALLFIMDSKNATVNNVMLIVFSVIMILIAGFRPPDTDKDYFVYKNYWYTKNISGDVEESLVLIRNLLKFDLDLSITSLFVVYAVLGVCSKMLGIRNIAISFFASTLLYFSHYFLLHEFTQIRIGVATGFMLLSLPFLYKRNLPMFLTFALISIIFHYSMTLILPLWFLRNNGRLLPYYLLVPIGYVYYFLNTVFNVTIPIPYFQDRIDGYQQLQELGFIEMEEVNVFNAIFLVRIALLYTFLIFAKKIAETDDHIFLLIKIYAISLFSFLFLAKMPVFAFRVQELYGVVEILLIPYLLILIPNKLVAKAAIVCIALAFLLFDIYYVKLILHV